MFVCQMDSGCSNRRAQEWEREALVLRGTLSTAWTNYAFNMEWGAQLRMPHSSYGPHYALLLLKGSPISFGKLLPSAQQSAELWAKRPTYISYPFPLEASDCTSWAPVSMWVLQGQRHSCLATTKQGLLGTFKRVPKLKFVFLRWNIKAHGARYGDACL